MTRARGDTGLDGFLNVCKPAGPTSHDVVARVRRALGTRRVGHAGTLDPLAEGVLPVALGRATRLIDRLAGADKEYLAEIVLGVRTTTDDAEGEVVETRPLPPFDERTLDEALAAFLGQIEQIPPAYSAVKVGGRRAYDLARAGRDLTLEPRRVTIYQVERRFWSPPVLGFTVRCSKGTYIRALARDLGERLGVGGSLRRLVRLRVGPFDLEQAVGLEEIERDGRRHVRPADVVLLDRPALVLGAPELDHLRHGRAWRAVGVVEGLARAYDEAGRFVGVLEGADGCWRPRLTLVD